MPKTKAMCVCPKRDLGRTTEADWALTSFDFHCEFCGLGFPRRESYASPFGLILTWAGATC